MTVLWHDTVSRMSTSRFKSWCIACFTEYLMNTRLKKISISDQTHLQLYNCYRDVHKACIVLHANFLFLIPRSEFHASSCVDPTSSYVNDMNLLILTWRRGWIHALSLHHQKPNVVVSHRRSPQVSARHTLAT